MMKLINVEWLKTRRTLQFYLCLGLPLLLSGIMFFIFHSNSSRLITQSGENRWLFISKMVQTYWSLFFLPFYITLETALQAGLEHNGQMWKLIFSMPVLKLSLVRAQYALNYVIIGISQILLIPFTMGICFLLKKTNPQLGIESEIPIIKILLLDLTVYGLSFLIITIHNWIAYHWENFVPAIGAGIAATVSGVILIGSPVAEYYPWTMPGLIADHFYENGFPWINLGYSLGLGIVIMLFSWIDLMNREVD